MSRKDARNTESPSVAASPPPAASRLPESIFPFATNGRAPYDFRVMTTRAYSKAACRIAELVTQELRRGVGEMCPRRIVLKPNWVLHETDPCFPIQALVTDARVIEAVAETCLEIFPDAESILVGDCPLQYADWPAMCQQSGLAPVIERLNRISHGKIAFRDLRKEVFQKVTGSFLTAAEVEHGDPRGYSTVSLGKRSHLEPISEPAARFAVNDYDASTTRSNARRAAASAFCPTARATFRQVLDCGSPLPLSRPDALTRWPASYFSFFQQPLRNDVRTVFCL